MIEPTIPPPMIITSALPARILRRIITEGEGCLSWKKVAEFQTRMKENIAALCTKFLEGGLARKESRLAALIDFYHRISGCWRRRRWDLTLVTCYPFYYVGSAPERFIVQARKIG